MTPRLDALRDEVENYLGRDLELHSEHSDRLIESMRYAVLGGGKRIRGVLVACTAQSLGADVEAALPVAASAEYLHAYSLIHDDLPDMDDSDLRRGRPSCHIAFGATTAILAGDALQSLAFSSISDSESLNAVQKAGCVASLARATGWRYMVGGQAMDMELEGAESASLDDVRKLAQAKTGALFSACLEMGCHVAGFDESTSENVKLSSFGFKIGEAFQVVDDYLDATQTAEALGKPTQADAEADKVTYVSELGVEGTKAFANQLIGEALDDLSDAGLATSELAEIARLCIERTH